MISNALTFSAGLHRFQQESLSLLTGVLDTSGAVSYLIDGCGKPVCYRTARVEQRMHRDYLQNHRQHDPLNPTLFMDDDAMVVRMNDLVSHGDRQDHSYYRHFVDPWGVKDIVEIFLRLDDRLVAGFALINAQDQKSVNTAYLQKVQKLHNFLQFSLAETFDSPRNLQFTQFCEHHQLTNKERLVVELVARGLPNKVIADRLDCSLATIKTHLQHIFQKLSINSKNELVALLFRTK